MDWFFVCLVWLLATYVTGKLWQQRKQISRLHTSGLRTAGVIAGYEYDGDGHIALVTFLTQQGYQQQTKTNVGHSPQEFPKGMRVTIMYNPNNPADCFVDTYVERQTGYILAIVLWLLAVGILGCLLLGLPLERSAA